LGSKRKEVLLRDCANLPYWKGTTGNRWPQNSPVYLDLSCRGAKSLLVSSGHEYHLLGKTNRNIGGNFQVIFNSLSDRPIPSGVYSTSGDASEPNKGHYHGPIFSIGKIDIGPGSYPSAILSSNSELDALGTTAIARVAPTNPVSGMLQTLVELKREGIPSLIGVQTWKNRTHLARSAGDEYLNHQFGWLPLVNDLKDFSYAVTNSDELIRQYERNSGKNIKRSYNWPLEVTNVSDVVTHGVTTAPTLEGGFYSYPPGVQNTSVVSERIQRVKWFKGCFTYYLPPYKQGGDNSKRNRQLANYLYGTRVTPELLWNLTPWSWAADWVGNFGDYLHNVSAFQNDGLVMKYGYVMETTIHSIERTVSDIYLKTGGGPKTCSSIRSTTTKSRRSATPYGFGLNVGLFTDRQWAIIGALGISKGSRLL